MKEGFNVSDLYRYDFSAAYIFVLALFTVILQKSFKYDRYGAQTTCYYTAYCQC